MRTTRRQAGIRTGGGLAAPALLLGGLLAAGLAAGSAATAAQERPSARPDSDRNPSPHSEASLVAEPEWIRPGEPFTVALRLELDEGWHTYWKNPGDSGTPAALGWNLPEGFSADSIRWPRPYRIPFPPLLSYAYEDEVWLPVRVTPPAELAPGSEVRLAARADWLVCEEVCLPARDSVATTVAVRDSAPPPADRWREDFREVRRSLPRAAGGWRFHAADRADSLVLAITPPDSWDGGLAGVYFFAGETEVVEHLDEHAVTWHGDEARIRLPKSPYLASVPDTLSGVLAAPEGRAWDEAGHDALRVAAPVVDSLPSVAARPGPSGFGGEPLASGSAAGESGGSRAGLLLLVAFAFAGGLLLNLMPCVFPILSLKILGFAERSGGERATMRRHGLAFGVGVVLSFLALAGVLMAARAAGSEVGWGFQLQSPAVVAVLCALMFAIGLNFLGVFEVGTSLTRLAGVAAEDERLRGSFLTGVLATVVASPCTAPFMGTAVGAALLGPPGQAPLVFGVMGVGMAVPYVALSFWPGLLERLPEPGRWMESLRQLLAFPMFAAALWLVWVFGLQTGVGGAARLLSALLLLAFAAWLLSRWRGEAGRRSVRLAARGAAVTGLVGAVVLVVGTVGSTPPPTGAAASSPSETSERDGAGIAWEDWSEEKVERYRSQGRPVFVDFTAAWCITCQVNERTVLSSDAVTAAFRQRDVAALKADWTRRDPAITRALESFGRSGVPLYVVYPPDPSAEPRVLPTVLTRDNVLEGLPAPSREVSAPEASVGDGAG